MERGACGVGPEAKGGASYDTSPPESGLRKEGPGLRDRGHDPTGIRWVVNQEDENGARFPIRFGVKVLSERKQGYT